ncbi:MAG: IS21-like element helper ATPase IstB [Pseudomonadota bacterium]
MDIRSELTRHLKELHLPTFRENFKDVARLAEKESLTYEQYLLDLSIKECEARRHRRIERYLRESCLPLEKTMDVFELKRLPKKVVHQVHHLLEGFFLDKTENVLAFGNPGTGKTHLLCAIAHALIHKEKRIYFTKCAFLVQKLLSAKKDLRLAQELKKMNKFDAIVIDDIGYVQQNQEEMEILFTFLAERYERGSVMITSNLPFSKWERIFKDPMTTAAAIDRVVHHSVILELNIPSYRMEQANKIQHTDGKGNTDADNERFEK